MSNENETITKEIKLITVATKIPIEHVTAIDKLRLLQDGVSRNIFLRRVIREYIESKKDLSF